ncbi:MULTISPECIES: glycosyl hydrolase [unclassified Rhizobium]|uniref:glycoside hydrolase family 26 protein n=1 Tax=unclassified Rhizobium TaxID=2613769 RepID=UPI000EA98536|nr:MULTISPECIES: glycosyl hydrolase [unclassified Rhizobium]AYG69819.1 beta-mannosidase [Rhizobium sp. CCGE531]AYG76194.1 beta-mannosidase [Rhizobium sp. CCGE532]
MKTASKLTAAVVCFAGLSGAIYAPNKGVETAGGSQSTFHDKRPIITPQSLPSGAYDPNGDFSNDPNPKIEHLFLPWEDVDLATLGVADSYARQRGRSLLITVEPWSWARNWRVTPDDLFQAIMDGHYDANMASICSAAAKLKQPVTIRWAQEMDEKNGQFTWAYWSPSQYVKAYKHAVDVCRRDLPSAEYMWSPMGKEGLEAYYPGDRYVDVVGISVFGYQPFDQRVLGRDSTFVEATKPAYDRVKAFGKPIVIAELGYQGNEAYVHAWAEEAAKPHDEFKNIVGVVYFDDREVYPWPHGLGLPDWRVVSPLLN